MIDHSVFMDKLAIPQEEDVERVLKINYTFWVHLKQYIYSLYPEGKDSWNFPGKKYGWSYRISDKKRAIMHFLPRDGYFKTAFVFGQKAFDAILQSDINQSIKNDLISAKKYAEGRGVSIDVSDQANIDDIKKLIVFKLARY